MSTKQFETFQGQRLRVAPFAANEIYAIPSAQFILNPGITERVQRAPNGEGIQTPVDQFKAEEDPQVTLRFTAGSYQPEILQFVLGRIFQTAASKNVSFINDAVVNSSLRIPGYGTNQTDRLGQGVGSDTGIAFTKDENGVSKQLTRESYVATGFGTDSTDVESFMVGSGLDLHFTPDLVGRTVVYQVDETITNVLELSDTEVPLSRIEGLLINTSREVWRFRAFEAKAILDGSSLDPSSEELSITFRLFTPAGRCGAYEMDFLGKVVGC